MLLQVQLTLLQKKFEGGGTGPLGPPPRSAPGSDVHSIEGCGYLVCCDVKIYKKIVSLLYILRF